MLLMKSTLPEKENLVYHIVIMHWWQKWKIYTGYDAIKVENEETTPGENESLKTESTLQEDL